MLAASFFFAFFISISWIIYMVIYINTHLIGVTIAAMGLMDLAVYSGLLFFPIFIIWSVWGYFYRFIQVGSVKNQIGILSMQVKQSHEYSDMITRILIQMSANSTNEFVLSKIDLFLGEMNEMLSDILTRYRLISQEQADKIWTEVQRGNKWGFSKAIINLKNSVKDFDDKMLDAAKRETLLAATISEFCARYTRMIELLKAHDKERIFIDIIETGAFGKVFAIFAPIYDKLNAFETEETITEIVEEEPVVEEGLSKHEKLEIQTQYEETIKLSDTEKEEDIIEPNIQETEESKETETIDIIEELIGDEEKIDELEQINKEIADFNTDEGFFSQLDKRMSKELQEGDEDIAFNHDEDIDSYETSAKKSFFPNLPKLGELFRRKKDEEELAELEKQYCEIDPLTIALERSFGKLSDPESVNLKEFMSKDPTDDKFAFANTDKTIKNLQQEWEKMKQCEKKEPTLKATNAEEPTAPSQSSPPLYVEGKTAEGTNSDEK